MPAGSTRGSKLISLAALVSSLSTRSSVRVPTSTCSRPAGQAMVASLVGSPGCPMMTMRCQRNGWGWICAISASKRSFLSLGAEAVRAASNGCTGVRIQRTGMESPAALIKRNAFRLWNVLLPNPDETGWPLMTVSACTVSGWRSRNAFILAGSGLPVLGSGFDARTCL